MAYVKVKSEEAAVRDVDVCVRTKDGRDGARVITTLSLWRVHAEMKLESGSVLLLVGIKAGVNVYKPTGFLSLWSQEEWALIPNFNSDQANELKAWYNEEGAVSALPAPRRVPKGLRYFMGKDCGESAYRERNVSGQAA